MVIPSDQRIQTLIRSPFHRLAQKFFYFDEDSVIPRAWLRPLRSGKKQRGTTILRET